MVDRIRYTSILGNTLIVEINLAVSINGYVLKQSISLDCVVDVGLGILVQVDNLSVALSSQPCSSSPISRRLGSVDRVVLPVPDRPKKIAVFSPFISVFAEQCMEAMPFRGR